MHEPTMSKRRLVLKMLGGAPMLPLGAVGAATLLAGCRAGADGARAAARGAGPRGDFAAAAFTSMAAPSLDAPEKMAVTTVESTLEVSFSDGGRQTFQLRYEPFFMTGDSVPDGQGATLVAGGYLDIHGRPIMDSSVPGKARQFFSDCPDGMSLLALPSARVPGVKGNTVFAVVQFEYASHNQKGESMYGLLPSPIAVLTLAQDPATGRLALVKYSPVDTAPAHGLWITCGASLSPWNTHLASEEYEPDATTARLGAVPGLQPQPVRRCGQGQSVSLWAPARSGGPPGRHRHHQEALLPGPHLARADPGHARPAHLSDGRRRHQRRAVHVRGRPQGRSVGRHALRRQVAPDLGRGPGGRHAGLDQPGPCPQRRHRGAGRYPDGGRHHGRAHRGSGRPGLQGDTRQRQGQLGQAGAGPRAGAAFLETHRYAALAGGTMAFSKMEGTTVNARDRIAYSAMSRIETSMVDGTSPDLRVQGPEPGAVYALNLRGGQRDSAGTAIDSEWVPVDMAAVPALVGEKLAAPDALGNRHHADRISNPDNIKFSEKLRTLFIGEDSNGHVNNFLWAYNVDSGALSRILSCPAGGESTGLQAVDEINGWTYITSNFQHAADWGGVHAVVRATLDPLVKASYRDGFGASVGYITIKP